MSSGSTVSSFSPSFIISSLPSANKQTLGEGRRREVGFMSDNVQTERDIQHKQQKGKATGDKQPLRLLRLKLTFQPKLEMCCSTRCHFVAFLFASAYQYKNLNIKIWSSSSFNQSVLKHLTSQGSLNKYPRVWLMAAIVRGKKDLPSKT